MKILVVNNEGAGEASKKEVDEGTTIGELFSLSVPGANFNDYQVRIDRELVFSQDQVLSDDSRVTITPTNIEGA